MKTKKSVKSIRNRNRYKRKNEIKMLLLQESDEKKREIEERKIEENDKGKIKRRRIWQVSNRKRQADMRQKEK